MALLTLRDFTASVRFFWVTFQIYSRTQPISDTNMSWQQGWTDLAVGVTERRKDVTFVLVPTLSLSCVLKKSLWLEVATSIDWFKALTHIPIIKLFGFLSIIGFGTHPCWCWLSQTAKVWNESWFTSYHGNADTFQMGPWNTSYMPLDYFARDWNWKRWLCSFMFFVLVLRICKNTRSQQQSN